MGTGGLCSSQLGLPVRESALPCMERGLGMSSIEPDSLEVPLTLQPSALEPLVGQRLPRRQRDFPQRGCCRLAGSVTSRVSLQSRFAAGTRRQSRGVPNTCIPSLKNLVFSRSSSSHVARSDCSLRSFDLVIASSRSAAAILCIRRGGCSTFSKCCSVRGGKPLHIRLPARGVWRGGQRS